MPLNKNSNIKVLLTGRPDELNKALEGLTYDKSRLEIVPASEVIETGAPSKLNLSVLRRILHLLSDLSL